MPVLAMNFTLLRQRIKTKKNAFVQCYDERQFESKGIFFSKRQKTPCLISVWCFTIIKVPIHHRLCCEYIQHLCSCWTFKTLPISCAVVWVGEGLSPSYFSCFAHRLCLLSTGVHLLQCRLLSPKSAVQALTAWEKLIWSHVTAHVFLLDREGCVPWWSGSQNTNTCLQKACPWG